MNKFLLLLLSGLMSITCFTQSLSRQVFSTLGGSSSPGSVHWSHTGGQPEHFTLNSSEIILTQGFEQPDRRRPILYETIIPVCDQGNGVSILIDILSVCEIIENSGILFDETPTTALVENVSPGSHTVEITCQNNSTHSIVIVIPVNLTIECDLVFYTAFSPHGSLNNQTWIIENIETEKFQKNSVSIYDRWGSLVWKGDNYNNEDVIFIGVNSNGEDLSQGTYFYVADFEETTFKGYIELIR